MDSITLNEKSYADLLYENEKLKKEIEKLRECINYLEGSVEFCNRCKNPIDYCIC